MLVDAVADRWAFPRFRKPWRWRARVSTGTFGQQEVILLKPNTYMNRSGGALAPLLAREGFAPERDLLVLVDEIMLPLGMMRIRPSGSSGGHNGLKSIAGRLQSEEYPRLRIGVGPRPDDFDQSEFLLSDFETDELSTLNDTMPRFVDAVETWIQEGIEVAMNRFNRKGTERD